MLLLLLFGCPESPCFEKGGGYGDYTAADLAGIQNQCEDDGGSDCAAGGFIEVGVATCLAEEAGLSESFDGSAWGASLVYHSGQRTPVWNVTNVEYAQTGEQGGSLVQIHATTGEVLAVEGWMAVE